MEMLFGELPTASIIVRLLIVLMMTAFIPLTLVTFFRYMMSKKVTKYYKALSEMGIQSSRRVSDTFSKGHYYLPVVFATLLCLIAFTYFAFADVLSKSLNESLLLSGGYFGEQNRGLITQGISVIQYAFLGGFLWSAYNLIRRVNNYDLIPSVYYNMSIRIILATLVALLVSFLIGDDTAIGPVNLNNWLPGLSFMIGIFPDRGLQYLGRRFRKILENETVTSKYLSLYHIEGMNSYHKDRLEENGIDNAQNLANASLTQLLVETPFEARLLIDWIGQAKLLCMAKEHMDGFRNIGIRTVFDFFRITKSIDDLVLDGQAQSIPSAKMDNIFHQAIHDNGIRSLVVFQNGLNAPSKDGEIMRPATRDNTHVPDNFIKEEEVIREEYIQDDSPSDIDTIPDADVPIIRRDDEEPVG